jgi:cobalt/nickel transport system permease protein
MTIVLVAQCLGFADGGLTALGTNIFNMGIIAGIGGYFIFKFLIWLLPKNGNMFLLSVAISSWLSVVLASSACAAELGLSGTSPFYLVFPAMVGIHCIIGLGEAIITLAIISMINRYRPDLLPVKYSVSGKGGATL